jgi:hypothetical protein
MNVPQVVEVAWCHSHNWIESFHPGHEHGQRDCGCDPPFHLGRECILFFFFSLPLFFPPEFSLVEWVIYSNSKFLPT